MTALSPTLVAALLGRPAPTPEQQSVITAPLEPGVVVAGAGSGKTETMASRVVWLVANGHVAPDEVLGLTFTRKAATELGLRVRRRLTALEATGRVHVPAGEPVISTYDAFAGRIVAEHGVRLGLEPGRRMLSPAGAWQRAARLVHSWDGDMSDVVAAPDTVIADVLDLHEQSASHLKSLDMVAAQSSSLRDLVESLPPGPRQRKPRHSKLEGVHTAQVTRLRIIDLVARYRLGLAQDDLTDFATVAADAATVATAFGEVGAALRRQFRLVLLDEFQDTSHAQLDLLLAVFGAGHAVTAVGDPNQSIYAWRGANADTLAAFGEQFAPGGDVARRSLSTSFRNATLVLDVANAVAGPLRSGPHHVASLVPAASAPRGEVHVALHRTKSEQASAVADQVVQWWQGGEPAGSDSDADHGSKPSIGVLVRKRDELPMLEAVLRQRGVPVEVVGLDGLLTVPEVADTVALLQVAADPSRGDALMRLLTGPSMRFGPRDLDALARWARHLTPAPAPGQPTWQVPRAGIAECLTHPPPADRLSPTAGHRLRLLARSVEQLRERLSRPLPDVVAQAVTVLGLDVESLARARRTGGSGSSHLDRIVDEAAQFAEVAPQAGVGEFLDYLAAAAQQERGLRRAAEVHLGSRVQLLTVHAAKGLEWDMVVVAGMNEGGFPARSRTGGAWLTDPGTLPYPLRGDHARLPQLRSAGVGDQSELAARVEEFIAEGREVDLAEERRLAYVAVTRARQVLACHGYRWGGGVRPLEPSRFLVEIAACPGVDVMAWTADPGDRPDLNVDAPTWPFDPLGLDRAVLESGAALVRDAIEGRNVVRSGELSGRASRWAEEVDLLLAEQASQRESRHRVRLPTHLSATALVAARRNPREFMDRLRRPMPVRPRVETRQGTAFHSWVEQRYGNPRLLDLDELPGAADAQDAPPSADLAELQQAFLASQWAERAPLEIEAPFEMLVGGVVVRGRADAVFADGHAGGLVVVDWKTGPPPTTSAEVEARSTQLAVYRQAFATLHGLAPHQVRAVFHHVRENLTIEERPSGATLDDVVAGVRPDHGRPSG